MEFHSVNPKNGETIGSYPTLSNDEAAKRIELSAAAQKSWEQLPLADRVSAVMRLADTLEAE